MSEGSMMIDKLGSLTEEFRKMNDRAQQERDKYGTELGETRATVNKLNDEITRLQGSIQEFRAARMIEGQGISEDPVKTEYRAAFDHYIRYGIGEKSRRPMDPTHLRSLSGTTDGDGGFLVPSDFETELLRAAFDAAEVRPQCMPRTTSRDSVKIGSMDQVSVAWGRRGISTPVQSSATGGVNIQVYDLKGLITIHNDVLDDAAANLANEISNMFGLAIAEAEDDAFVVGDGSGEPQGVLTNAQVIARAVNTGVAANIFDSTHNGVDPLITALHTLKKAYRRSAVFAMNSSTEAAVRKLKDENGQYLWSPPVALDRPATLLGRGVINPEGMPDIAANAFPILCGSFIQGYRIYDRSGVTIRRLDELFAQSDETGFMVKRRTGGGVVIAEAFVPVKCAA